MSAIIVHSLPYNPEVCGGIKVHYQLAMLEQQLGYDVFMIYDNPAIPEVSWFSHTCKEMTLSVFKDYLVSSGRNIFLLIGYENPSSLDILEAYYKVAYIQGHSFYKEGAYRNAFLWFNSRFCKEFCKVDGEIVPPYLSRAFTHIQLYSDYKDDFSDPKFYNVGRRIKLPEDDSTDGTFSYLSDTYPYLSVKDNVKDKYTVLIQERKSGKEVMGKILSLLSDKVLNKLNVIIHKNSSEREFALALKAADIFIAHSYPEGFNLPPLEAMSLGTVVIGYTGGGGSDFMSKDNCLLAPDGDVNTVANRLAAFVLRFQPKDILDMRLNGKCATIPYNVFSTFKILRKIFRGYHLGAHN